jgi:hypothetical protein
MKNLRPSQLRYLKRGAGCVIVCHTVREKGGQRYYCVVYSEMLSVCGTMRFRYCVMLVRLTVFHFSSDDDAHYDSQCSR